MTKGDPLEYQQFVQAHDEALLNITTVHRTGLGRIVGWHIFRAVGFDSSLLEESLQTTRQGLDTQLADTNSRLERRLDETRYTLDDLLAKDHMRLLKRVERDIRKTSVGMAILGLANEQPLVSSVLRAGLDAPIFASIKDRTSKTEFEHGWGMTVSASSEVAADAMDAALDEQVFKQVNKDIKRFGIENGLSKLDYSSSEDARKAMRAAIDIQAFVEVCLDGGRPHRIMHPKFFSDDAVRQVMWQYFTRQPRAEEPFDGDSLWEEVANRLGGHFGRGSGGETFRDLFGDNFVWQTDRPKPSPKAEPKPVDRLFEARAIVRKVTNERCSNTLSREEPANIAKVITTVRLIRERAEKEGRTITDREIYIRFRRRIESGEASESLLRSTTILLNLMNDEPSGNLPF